MLSIRTGFAVLLSAAICLAQTASTHHSAQNTQGAIVSGTSSTGATQPTIVQGGWINTTGGTWVETADGLGWTTTAGSLVYYLNDHTAGIETRPLDDKGPTLTEVEYSASKLQPAQLVPASYIDLAKQIHLDSPPLDEAQILQTIYDHHFRVYDFGKVDNYLYRQALKQGARVRWVWKPMRTADLKVLQAQTAPSTEGIVLAQLYEQKIPGRVLEDVKCVLNEIPDAVMLISDYAVVHPDPFLAITTPKLLAQGKLWIVDRWDEPGFQDKGTTVGKPGGEPSRDVVTNQSPVGGDAELVAALD